MKKVLIVAGAIPALALGALMLSPPGGVGAPPDSPPEANICKVDSPVGTNTKVVIAAGREAKVSQFGIEVALGVILVESGALNLASQKVPESLKYPNDGVVPGDHMSIGPFQQQVGMGWFDTVAHGMEPSIQAASFFTHLKAIPGWEQLPYGTAAQAVQGSAFPDRYAQRQADAQALYTKWGNRLTCQGSGVIASPGGVPQSGHWADPLAKGTYTIGSPFGPRNGKVHYGQDLPVATGTPVHSVCDGVVLSAAADPFGGGLMVKTDCGSGIVAESMHNLKLIAQAGDTVKAGQVIALSDSTGNSSGPHVHIQIDVGGVPIDPIPFFASRGVPL